MPTDTLFYGPVLISVGVSTLIQFSFQFFYYMNIQKQPFYIPPYNIGKSDKLQDQKYVSYEDTVLFYVTNFQYIMTCVSFSISKPFRKQIWTNSRYFVSLILLVIFATVAVFVPPNTPIYSLFTTLPFVSQNGDVFYDYRYFIFVGILLNSILTYAAEKIIIEKVTKAWDVRKDKKRYQKFDELMDTLRPQPT